MIAGLLQPFTYGRGYPLLVPIGVPAAGAVPATQKVTGGYWWRVLAYSVSLTTSAAVANRELFIDYLDGDGNVVFRSPAAAVQVASLTVRYSFAIGYDFGVVAGGVGAAPLPTLFLEPGWSVAFGVTAIDVGDALTKSILYVEQFSDGDAGYPLGPIASTSPPPAI